VFLKGTLTGDSSLIAGQRLGLEGFNATKSFYWPSKTVILAVLDGDVAKLTTQVGNIEKKFDGYARKRNALDKNGEIDLCKLDLHFFCPYADIAFYAMATQKHGRFLKDDSFWLPTELVHHCAAHFNGS
jgi:hypothetical protein